MVILKKSVRKSERMIKEVNVEGSERPCTIKLKVNINGTPVLKLVDSGAIHNFVPQ